MRSLIRALGKSYFTLLAACVALSFVILMLVLFGASQDLMLVLLVCVILLLGVSSWLLTRKSR